MVVGQLAAMTTLGVPINCRRRTRMLLNKRWEVFSFTSGDFPTRGGHKVYQCFQLRGPHGTDGDDDGTGW